MDASDAIIDGILDREGGYQRDPADTGNYAAPGRLVGTNMGITPHALAGHRGVDVAAITAADMQALPRAEARAIYRRRYIEQPGFDAISDPELRESVIDAGVNMGAGWAARRLQEVLGVKADGAVGPETLAALAARSAEAVNLRFIARRNLRYARIVDRSVWDASAEIYADTHVRFLVGWIMRANAFLVAQAEEIERRGVGA